MGNRLDHPGTFRVRIVSRTPEQTPGGAIMIRFGLHVLARCEPDGSQTDLREFSLDAEALFCIRSGSGDVLARNIDDIKKATAWSGDMRDMRDVAAWPMGECYMEFAEETYKGKTALKAKRIMVDPLCNTTDDELEKFNELIGFTSPPKPKTSAPPAVTPPSKLPPGKCPF